jgi:hypothetical protein
VKYTIHRHKFTGEDSYLYIETVGGNNAQEISKLDAGICDPWDTCPSELAKPSIGLVNNKLYLSFQARKVEGNWTKILMLEIHWPYSDPEPVCNWRTLELAMGF